MSILQAILLGIIQGLTEFLPISSTAHVTIAGAMMDLVSAEHPERWTAFLAVIQIGTLLAVLLYFRSDLRSITTAFWRDNIAQRQALRKQSLESRLGWFIILGSIPIAVVGLAFKKIIEGEATKDPVLIACSLIGLALVLALAEKMANLKKGLNDISLKDALIVGAAQCLALIPGSSRSGTTITAGLFLGMRRDVAARFSFLLSVPAVLGSGMLEFVQSIPDLDGDAMLTLFIATAASALSGYAAIAFLLRFLRTRTTAIFIVYRILLGLVVLWLVHATVL